MPNHSQFIRNIVVDIILTLITCGLFNFYVQYKQIEAINAVLKENRYSFLHWVILSFITCGIYHIYHEWRKSNDISNHVPGAHKDLGIVSLILTCLGLHIVADALQQVELNKYFGDHSL